MFVIVNVIRRDTAKSSGWLLHSCSHEFVLGEGGVRGGALLRRIYSTKRYIYQHIRASQKLRCSWLICLLSFSSFYFIYSCRFKGFFIKNGREKDWNYWQYRNQGLNDLNLISSYPKTGVKCHLAYELCQLTSYTTLGNAHVRECNWIKRQFHLNLDDCHNENLIFCYNNW